MEWPCATGIGQRRVVSSTLLWPIPVAHGHSILHKSAEEGSELYHNYEVHLVSEHIWCDDYLVRSFYLKNLKTSETRTVTQFHFLSWPESGVPPNAKSI